LRTAPTPPEGEMADDPLTPGELDLAALGAYAVQDGFLLDLIMLADEGISTSVGLLVNGMIVIGAISSPSLAAGEVDAERRRIAGMSREPEGMDDEEWARTQETFATVNATAFRRTEAERARLEREVAIESRLGDAPIDPASVRPSLARELIAYRARPFLTLREVQVVAPGTRGVANIAVMRVAVGQIGAWWVIRHDQTGRASFPLFEDPGRADAGPGGVG
jgi:hypothetical protein